jgi:hypothetical protein
VEVPEPLADRRPTGCSPNTPALRFVDVDLADLAATAATLGRAVATGLAARADTVAEFARHPGTPADVVAEIARLHGSRPVLNHRLRRAVPARRPGHRPRCLHGCRGGAYQPTADRINTMLASAGLSTGSSLQLIGRSSRAGNQLAIDVPRRDRRSAYSTDQLW